MKKSLVFFLKGSDASSANVTVGFLTVFHVRNFLYVYLERSSRLTVGVAYVVAGSLTLTANITYSRHIDTSDRNYFAVVNAIFLVFVRKKIAWTKTSINNIPFLKRKINQN